MNVRQKHAHSWVEASSATTARRPPRPLWLTLDPTPGNERDESVAQVGGFRGELPPDHRLGPLRLGLLHRRLQLRAAAAPPLRADPRRWSCEARRGFEMMGEELRTGYAGCSGCSHFPTRGRSSAPRVPRLVRRPARSWSSSSAARSGSVRTVRRAGSRGGDEDVGGAVGGPVALPPAGAAPRRARPGAPAGRDPGRVRPPRLRLPAGRGSSTEAVADVPPLVVDAFYRVRFGHLDLTRRDPRAPRSPARRPGGEPEGVATTRSGPTPMSLARVRHRVAADGRPHTYPTDRRNAAPCGSDWSGFPGAARARCSSC